MKDFIMTNATIPALTVGNQYRFKRTVGKGRPFVGTLTRKLGALVEFETKTGVLVRVQAKYVKAPYEFRNYNTKNNTEAA